MLAVVGGAVAVRVGHLGRAALEHAGPGGAVAAKAAAVVFRVLAVILGASRDGRTASDTNLIPAGGEVFHESRRKLVRTPTWVLGACSGRA
ncbi:hypothetical protein GCM10028815_09320 [Mariniluteicoccus flavus]